MPVPGDVIIAGGGIAGTAAAAALAQLNYRVLVVEPGLDHTRRLAGELIHPPGVAALRDLGLLACLQQAGGIYAGLEKIRPKVQPTPLTEPKRAARALNPEAEDAIERETGSSN